MKAMKLRAWQTECIDLVIKKYKSNKRHFLCLATPAAGKTTMAAEVTATLFKDDLIDFVLCFSPSKIVAKSLRETMEERTDKFFHGLMGAGGGSFTYQGMPCVDSTIMGLLKSHRVFVIFDEIHHCSGTTPENANSWGQEIITKIQHQAAYTLALTGTPWRSDNTPIVLAEYQPPGNRILCDYVYGLAEAIKDGVCRSPRVVITDSTKISIQENDGDIESYESFSELLNETKCPYQKVIENEAVIRYLIIQANNKLTEIRKVNSNAGGLVVASSIKHANNILNILQNELNVPAVIVTYCENDPTTIIDDFKVGSTPWIVSVGMISEGTDVPRLQVCCHLSRIKTELHFRQVFGRILRAGDSQNEEAYMFMPAEQKLIDYAKRIEEEIPSENAVVRFENSETPISITEPLAELKLEDKDPHNGCTQTEPEIEDESCPIIVFQPITTPPRSRPAYDATINVYGQFHHEILAASISPF